MDSDSVDSNLLSTTFVPTAPFHPHHHHHPLASIYAAAPPAPGWPSNNFSCLTPHLVVHGITVYNPVLLPFMLFGFSVGVWGLTHLKQFRHTTRGGLIYSIMFLFFACMNLSGFFANGFFPSGWTTGQPSSKIATLLALTDAYCTSIVNFCFILCALVDTGILKERSFPFMALLVGGLVSVGYGYAKTFEGKWKNGFMILYYELCLLGFLVFVVGALVFLLHNTKVLKRGFIPLVTAVLSGVLGIKSLQLGDWFCNHISTWLNNITVWFFFSGTALLSLYIYFKMTIPARIATPPEVDQVQILVPAEPSEKELLLAQK